MRDFKTIRFWVPDVLSRKTQVFTKRVISVCYTLSYFFAEEDSPYNSVQQLILSDIMTELTKKFVSVISNTIQSMIEKELR